MAWSKMTGDHVEPEARDVLAKAAHDLASNLPMTLDAEETAFLMWQLLEMLPEGKQVDLIGSIVQEVVTRGGAPVADKVRSICGPAPLAPRYVL